MCGKVPPATLLFNWNQNASNTAEFGKTAARRLHHVATKLLLWINTQYLSITGRILGHFTRYFLAGIVILVIGPNPPPRQRTAASFISQSDWTYSGTGTATWVLFSGLVQQMRVRSGTITEAKRAAAGAPPSFPRFWKFNTPRPRYAYGLEVSRLSRFPTPPQDKPNRSELDRVSEQRNKQEPKLLRSCGRSARLGHRLRPDCSRCGSRGGASTPSPLRCTHIAKVCGQESTTEFNLFKGENVRR